MAYDDMSIDHIEPVGQGGFHEHDNVQLAHLSCNLNRQKGPYGIDRRWKNCKRGHDLTILANVKVRQDGERRCRICERATNNASKRKRKAAKNAAA